MGNAIRRLNSKGDINCIPNEMSKATVNEKVFNSLKRATRATTQVSFPIPFCQVILGKSDSIFNVP
jgi:hypothetical protein